MSRGSRSQWEGGAATVKTRAQIVAEARHLRAEIEQIFLDCAHWNRIHPNEEPIDCDSDGELRRMADGLDRMLAREGGGRA